MSSIHATNALPSVRPSEPSGLAARTRFQVSVKDERLCARVHGKDWATAMAAQPSEGWPSSPTSWSERQSGLARVSREGLSACSHFPTASQSQALRGSVPDLPKVSCAVQANPQPPSPPSFIPTTSMKASGPPCPHLSYIPP